MSVVNAHLNELPVKFSLCASESQDKLPTFENFFLTAHFPGHCLLIPF